MKNQTLITVFIFVIISVAFASCKKYLEAKPDQSLSVVSTLADMQGLMDYYLNINYKEAASGEVSTNDFYLTAADWEGRPDDERRMYTWEPDRIFALQSNPWRDTFQPVFVANTVLASLEAQGSGAFPTDGYNEVRGQALMLRGRCLLQALGIWCLAPGTNTDGKLGLPLRLDPDFNKLSVRSSLQQTIGQIEKDLLEASTLMKPQSLHPLRGSRAGAYGLLARFYLYIGKFKEAGDFAGRALSINSSLMDFNGLSQTANFPIVQFNPEVIYHSRLSSAGALLQARARVSEELLSLYSSDDLRKLIFFRAGTQSTTIYKGSYDGSASMFNGIAVNELLLIRAESSARVGSTELAAADLNTLLVKRWRKGTFVSLVFTNAADALDRVLLERRKELCFKGLRWMDIKRLNELGANIGMKRMINGREYTLPPRDLRFALPIPDDVITLSGMPQNPR